MVYQLISRNSFQLQWNYFSFRKIHNYQMWNNVNILFILEYFVNTSLVPNSITILIAHNFCKKVQIFHNSYTCTLTLLLPLLKAQYCLSKKIGDDWEKKRCFKNLLPLPKLDLHPYSWDRAEVRASERDLAPKFSSEPSEFRARFRSVSGLQEPG